jgi:hypothetical protein
MPQVTHQKIIVAGVGARSSARDQSAESSLRETGIEVRVTRRGLRAYWE